MAVNLSSGEEVRFETRQHPIVFLPAAAVLLYGLLLGGDLRGFLMFVGVVFGILTLLEFLTSTYTVTSHRVIAKWGIFGRHSMDLRIKQIDSMNEKTSLMGLLFGAFGFGYATVVVSTSGNNAIQVQKVFRPKEFVAAYHQAATDLDEGTRQMAQHAQQRAAVAGALACPSCGQLNPAGTGFCGSCGGALAAKCPACGALSITRFCGSCGADATALSGAPAARELGA